MQSYELVPLAGPTLAMAGCPGHSCVFTLLGKLRSGRTLHSIQTSIQGTFDIHSGEGGLDQPLCQECTDNLLEHLHAQLMTSESDRQDHERCLETRERVSDGHEDPRTRGRHCRRS